MLGCVAFTERGARGMRSLDFGRYALSSCVAAAMLVGCGGSQPPIGAPTVIPSDTPSGSRTFPYTGNKQTFKVPHSVTKITVVVRGAAGGAGARGGRVFAIIPVTSGEKLAVFVGGQPSGITGGFNGGAGGGMNRHEFHDGFGGGGASDIREGGDRLIDRIVIAGGG